MTTEPIATLNAIADDGMAAVIDVAQRAVPPVELDVEAIHHVLVPAGGVSKIIDLEQYQDTPRRRRSLVEHHTGASLSQYVQEQQITGTRLFADVYGRSIVAVVNGHEAAAGTPGWGDHRATLKLRHTPEWTAWAALDRRLMSQTDFAEHIEDHLDDIREPPGADMLELAKTFEAKTNIQFRQATVLESGQRQLEYVETIDARAGAQGSIVIPKEFVLGIAPFEGSEPYKIVARLRYRIGDGRLTIGYQLVQAEEVQRAAFADTLTQIEAATELTAFRGLAPA